MKLCLSKTPNAQEEKKNKKQKQEGYKRGLSFFLSVPCLVTSTRSAAAKKVEGIRNYESDLNSTDRTDLI